MITSGRMPSSAAPSTSSECPCPYTSAVSKKLHPRSWARRTARCDSASSVAPYELPKRLPPMAHAPKPTRLTARPVRPSTRRFTRAGPGAIRASSPGASTSRSEEHTSELQSQSNLVCRLLLEKKKKRHDDHHTIHL